jgi:hypothetical protein
MLCHLPTNDHSPRPSAGIWLVAAALLLIPVDLALFSYWRRNRGPGEVHLGKIGWNLSP